jgi:hypothetical protein
METVEIPTDLPARLTALMEANPELSAYGWNWEAPSDVDYEKYRENLRKAVSVVAAVMGLLGECPRTREPAANSYAIKHFAERIFALREGRYCGHVSNGATIAAALLMGIAVKETSSPNLLLGISRNWLALLEKAAMPAKPEDERARWIRMRMASASQGEP